MHLTLGGFELHQCGMQLCARIASAQRAAALTAYLGRHQCAHGSSQAL